MWQSVTCVVHNIIVGKLWFEYVGVYFLHYIETEKLFMYLCNKCGTMEIVCVESGYKAVLNYKPYSWSNKELNKVEGFIYDNK
jgi:hypothetical protein